MYLKKNNCRPYISVAQKQLLHVNKKLDFHINAYADKPVQCMDSIQFDLYRIVSFAISIHFLQAKTNTAFKALDWLPITTRYGRGHAPSTIDSCGPTAAQSVYLYTHIIEHWRQLKQARVPHLAERRSDCCCCRQHCGEFI